MPSFFSVERFLKIIFRDINTAKESLHNSAGGGAV